MDGIRNLWSKFVGDSQPPSSPHERQGSPRGRRRSLQQLVSGNEPRTPDLDVSVIPPQTNQANPPRRPNSNINNQPDSVIPTISMDEIYPRSEIQENPRRSPSPTSRLPPALQIPDFPALPVTEWDEEGSVDSSNTDLHQLRVAPSSPTEINELIREKQLPKLDKSDLVEGDTLFFEFDDGKKPSFAGTPSPSTDRKPKRTERNAVRIQKAARRLAPSDYKGDPHMRHALIWALDSSGNEIIQANYKRSDPNKQKVMAKPLNLPGRYIVYRHKDGLKQAKALAFVREAAELAIPYAPADAATVALRPAKTPRSPGSGSQSPPPSPQSPEHDSKYFCSQLLMAAYQSAEKGSDAEGSNNASSTPSLMEYKAKNTSPMDLHHITESSDEFEAVGYIDIADPGGPSSTSPANPPSPHRS